MNFEFGMSAIVILDVIAYGREMQLPQMFFPAIDR
jgi:hypothetical protein